MFRNQYSMIIYKSPLEIFVDRKNLFYDTYNQIMNKSPVELRKSLNVKFKKEEGIDFGGLSR